MGISFNMCMTSSSEILPQLLNMTRSFGKIQISDSYSEILLFFALIDMDSCLIDPVYNGIATATVALQVYVLSLLEDNKRSLNTEDSLR